MEKSALSIPPLAWVAHELHRGDHMETAASDKLSRHWHGVQLLSMSMSPYLPPSRPFRDQTNTYHTTINTSTLNIHHK